MQEANAWDYERRLKQTLSKFNIQDLEQKVGDLSGGQKTTVLGYAAFDAPELLCSMNLLTT